MIRRRARPGWWPGQHEALAVAVAVLIGTGAGLATRPDRSIHRASETEVAAARASTESASAAGRALGASATTLLPATPLRSGLAVGDRSSGGDAERDLATPARLSVPVLGLFDARIRPVGTNDDGSMTVPPITEVGWYQHAGRPDGQGSTVLAAHVAAGGKRGLFARLAELRHGDRVQVDLGDGRATEWEVDVVITYAKAKLPVTDLFRADGDPRLVLITCGGAIDPLRGSYGDNIVVLAHPVA